MDGKITSLGAFALSVCVTVAAAADCKAVSESDVMRAELGRYAAQTGDDFVAMERIIGDDLVYIHSSSVVDGKESYIDSMRSGTVKYRTMRMLDNTIRIYDCLAIMTGTARFEVTVKGSDITVDLRFSEAWAKRGDHLQFVSWQATRIPQQQ
ncbi:MAG: nuclear transport factor 2 family protein [Burkholderiales bacterium]